jgi:hypothetical protein
MKDSDTVINIDIADSKVQVIFQDNGGRRMGAERRSFSYSLYVPERRTGADRRKGKDRRKAPRIYVKS